MLSMQIFPVSMHVGNYHLKNMTWFSSKLHQYPALYFEMDFEVQFPASICCPIVALSMFKGHFNECFEEGLVPDSWYKNALFYLEPKTRSTTNIKCDKNSTLDTITCKTLRVVDQDYVPKQRYLYFGYRCTEVHNFTKVDLKITMYKELNETSCQKIVTFDQPGNVLSCSQFYPYTSLPNSYGDSNQAEAEKSMVIFNNYFNNHRGSHCHKHLMRLVCMTFLPMCPDTELHENGSMPKTNHLIPPCKEAALEVVDACAADIKLFADFSTAYFPTKGEIATCYYERVQCDKPPLIENGQTLDNRTLFYAKDTVYFVCKENFQLLSNQSYSECSFSGFWTSPPLCEKPQKNTTSPNKKRSGNPMTSGVITVISVVFVFAIALAIIAIVKKLNSDRFKIHNNADLVSRNRQYDAFLSYESGDNDEQFVRTEICPKLDSEYGGRFKLLIHQRDFPAGTLIMANIQNAVRDSNCAIILLSQMYINSRWCQQEFEECMEESRKDENYRLIVILMKPIEILKKEKLSAYMKSFLHSKTYLELSDNRLWTKLEGLLEKHKTLYNIEVDAETQV